MSSEEVHISEWEKHLAGYADEYMQAVHALMTHLSTAHNMSDVALLAGSVTPDALLSAHVRAHFLAN